MKNIAVVAGGNSGEYEISIKSGGMVMKTLDPELFKPYFLVLKGNDWHVEENGEKCPVDKNDFSINLKGEKIRFDAVYLIIHGTPGEDGRIQGYFDLIGMPFVGPGLECCALSMNKAISKTLVAAYGIPTAQSIVVRKGEKYDINEIIKKLTLPCFVKPNNGGSSVATAKVYKTEAFEPAVLDAFNYDNEVICEEFLKGMEITCGIYHDGKTKICLPLTEIVPHNDFFDYRAKYMGESDEVTPARVSEEMKLQVNELTKKIYTILQCSGLVRIDFIIRDNIPYFMEANTIPGFSEQSIIPQQIRASGMKERDVLTFLLNRAMK